MFAIAFTAMPAESQKAPVSLTVLVADVVALFSFACNTDV
jgi:hypothetical protein